MLNTSFRNLHRNRRRTLACALAIIVGCIAILLSTGFIEWIYWAMRESQIQTGMGHIQIARPGYWDDSATDPAKFLIYGSPVGIETLSRDARIKAVAPRMQFNGLASLGDTTVSFLGVGIEPEAEESLSKFIEVLSGEKLAAGDSGQVVLGKGLAAALGAKPGDAVVLLVNTPSGGVNAVEVKVRGTFSTGVKATDNVSLRVPIALARSLTRSSGTHVWAIALKETEMTDAVLLDARQALGSSGLELRPWTALADFYNKGRAFLASQMNFVVSIIGIIVVLVISNLMIMNVLERTGEIGTMLALGTPRRQVLLAFFGEGLLLGLAASAVGIAIGALLALAISAVGISMPPPPGRDVGFLGEIRLTMRGVALTFMVGVLASTLACVYPAWKASRLLIVDALRHNR